MSSLSPQVKAALREKLGIKIRATLITNGLWVTDVQGETAITAILNVALLPEIERSMTEAREDVVSECSKWVKHNANSDRYLKSYIAANGLHVDSNQLSWDLKQAITQQTHKELES